MKNFFKSFKGFIFCLFCMMLFYSPTIKFDKEIEKNPNYSAYKADYLKDYLNQYKKKYQIIYNDENKSLEELTSNKKQK